jgi:hypothetical protein
MSQQRGDKCDYKFHAGFTTVFCFHSLEVSWLIRDQKFGQVWANSRTVCGSLQKCVKIGEPYKKHYVRCLGFSQRYFRFRSSTISLLVDYAEDGDIKIFLHCSSSLPVRTSLTIMWLKLRYISIKFSCSHIGDCVGRSIAVQKRLD